jgi:membrane protease YdiL (CAAX protease family)
MRSNVLGQEYAGSEALAFDRLHLDTEYLALDIEAGMIVPALVRGEVSGAVVFGLGWAKLDLPPDLAAELSQALGTAEFREDFEVLYLPATYQSLERLKDLAKARPAEDPEHIRLAQDVLDLQAQDPGLLSMFGRPSPGAPPSSPTSVRVYTVSFGRVDYVEGPRVVLVLEKPLLRSLSFPHPGRGAPAFPQLYTEPVLLVTILLYVVLGAMLWVLCFALTLHIKEPEWGLRADASGGGLPLRPVLMPGTAFAPPTLPLAVLGGYLISYLLAAALFGKSQPTYIVEILLAVILGAWAWRSRIPGAHLGLTGRAVKTSILAGVLVGFYLVVAGSIGYPSGLRPLSPASWILNVFRALLLVAPARELLLRGVAQTSLERYVGRIGAILVPAAIGGLAYLGAGLIGYGAAGRQLEPLLMEGLLVVPVSHALAGYLFMRTRNITAPWLVTGLVELLPRVLAF